MADSITLTGDKHNSRYFELKCTQTSNGSAKNSSTIKWTLSAKGDSTYYSTGPTKVVINGTTVYSKERVDWSVGKFPVAQGSTSGELVVAHNTDGSKEITVKFSTAIYGSTVKEYSDKWTLDSIPRYGTSAQSLNSKTETSIKMNWSSDSTVDYLWYSKDNGSTWTGVNVTDGKTGTYTISGLSANTTYKIKTRIRRKDSQLTTDSAVLSVTTYDYPYCTDSPNFVLGNEVTLKFYNPLKRAFKFYIIGNGKQIDVEYNCSTTSYKGVNNPSSSVAYLYATIPNAKEGKYQVKVVYGTSTKTRNNGNKYTINEKVCYPTFSTFTYKDTNATITALTGNNQAIVKGLSKLVVEIPSANKMVAKNSATPVNYTASIDAVTKSVNYSATNAVTIDLGSISTAGAKRLNVRAYDSRTLSTLAYKDVTVYDYFKPKINVSAKRLNNFEASTTVKISGEYARLTIGGADKNAIQTVQYRYRETNGSWSGWVTLTATVSAGKFTCNDVYLTLDISKSFEIEVSATDKLQSNTGKADVDVGQAIFFVSSNKKTAYLNGEEVATRNNVKQLVYYTQLAENTDLNSIVAVGTYRSIQASHTATMKNTPSGLNGGFTMHVYSWSGNPTSTGHRRQELLYAQRTYIRRTLDGGATWSEWYMVGLISEMYPVGSVYCNSTNTNPSGFLGGTWELIDKGFTASAVNDTTIFTPATNVVLDSAYITRGYSTIRIRLGLTINATLNDNGMALGTLNWSKVGITQLPMGFGEQVTYSDAGNGGIVWNVAYNTGGINVLDVIDATSIESGKTFSLNLIFNVVPSVMTNSFCDKFYWRRTS